jgi:hypothetical protein
MDEFIAMAGRGGGIHQQYGWNLSVWCTQSKAANCSAKGRLTIGLQVDNLPHEDRLETRCRRGRTPHRLIRIVLWRAT